MHGATQSGRGAGGQTGSTGESKEVCGDGLDNDRDGKPDNGCSCVVPDQTQECWVANPKDTTQVCRGTQTCKAVAQENLVWNDCTSDCKVTKCSDTAKCGNGASRTSEVSCEVAKNDETMCAESIDFVLVLDRSGSMGQSIDGYYAKLDYLKAATGRVLNHLLNRGGIGKNGKHRVGVVAFPIDDPCYDFNCVESSNAGRVISLASGADADTIWAEVANWWPNSDFNGTPTRDAMRAAMAEMKAGGRGKGVRRVFVLLSDGVPEPEDEVPSSTDIARFRAAADDVYTVAFGADFCIPLWGCKQGYYDATFMQSMATGDPATHFRMVSDPHDLADVFVEVARDACIPRACK